MTTDASASQGLGRLGAETTVREINQQPQLWRQVAATASAKHDQKRDFLLPLLARPNLRIVMAGAGTSAFVGQILAPALASELHRRVDAVATTDIVSNPKQVFAEDVPTLLVSFARSGDSPESVAATELADRCLSQVAHLIVTCSGDGRLFRDRSDDPRSLVLLMPPAANDQGFAMTSSFSCMLLAAWLTLTPGKPADSLIDHLADAGEQVLRDRLGDARELAHRGYHRVVYLGSGALKGLARESALKLLELSAGGTPAFFDSALGFRHGPKAVLDERTLVVVYLSNDPYTRSYDEDIAVELRHGIPKDNVVAVAGRPSDRLGVERLWRVKGMDNANDALLSLPFVIHAQLLALQLSLASGCTPDNPFPSGNVNRVVQGVTIHPLLP